MNKQLVFLIFLVFNVSSFAADSKSKWILTSPDKSIKLFIYQEKDASENTNLFYSVQVVTSKLTRQLINKSPLGLVRNDAEFGVDLTFEKSGKLKRIIGKYSMPIGRQTKCAVKANELSLYFKNSKGSFIRIDFRIYNDGIAFRYVFPEKSNTNYLIEKELTGFSVSQPGKAWIQPYDKPTKWTPGYEDYYKNGIPIGAESPNIEGWAFPALFQSMGLWALISESNLTENYCGIRLESSVENGIYRVRFPEKMDGEGTGKVNPESTLPWIMPWRTIIIGKSLSDIFSSTMINSLAEPTVSDDFSWVKPGRSSWSWLSENDSPKNFNALKKFVDLSANMKWEYSLVDANWDLMTGGNIEQLVQYANTKNVGILLWYNSGGAHNTILERPRDIVSDSVRRKTEFAKLQKMGVKGVKIDFWQSDKQNMISLYCQVLKDAAEHHLLVNLHGCTIPRGWSRTYPNLVSMESVKGEEAYLFDSTYSFSAPVQNTILPFTRNVLGPMDYTPVVFSDLKFPHLTTYTHELALSLIHNSGIIHFADNETVYKILPDFVRNFLSNVPVGFDETKLISGYPGEHVIIAARKGTVWYIAGISALNQSLSLNIDCSFLKDNVFKMKLINDSPLREMKFVYKEENVSSKGFNVNILQHGGFVAVLSKN